LAERIRGFKTLFPKAVLDAALSVIEGIKAVALRHLDDPQYLNKRSGELFAFVSGCPILRAENFVLWGLPKGTHQSMVAYVQEVGTVGKGGELPTIVPVNGQFLRIPVPGGPALSGAGVDVYAGTPLRQIEGFFVKGRQLCREDAPGQIVAWYNLVTHVDIRPKRWFRDAVEGAREGIAKAAGYALSVIVKGERR
jgi:hypothetical protein